MNFEFPGRDISFTCDRCGVDDLTNQEVYSTDFGTTYMCEDCYERAMKKLYGEEGWDDMGGITSEVAEHLGHDVKVAIDVVADRSHDLYNMLKGGC